MTWIICTPFVFGYTVLIGDVQASELDQNGCIIRKEDCVRKIYPLSCSLVCGFAGDIRMGFAITQAMRDFLKLLEGTEQKRWDPEYLKGNLPRVMNKRWKELSDRYGEERVEFIIGGVHPTACIPKDTEWRLPYCHIYKSENDFQPEEIGIGKIESIGSGAQKYVEKLEKIQNDRELFTFLVNAGSNIDGGYASGLMNIIAMEIRDNPTEGISDHLFTFIATDRKFPDDVMYSINDREKLPGWEEFKMPEVADSWEKFQKLWKRLTDEKGNASACIG